MHTNRLSVACTRCLKKQNVPSDVAETIIDFWMSSRKEEFVKKLSEELEAVKVALAVRVCTAMWDIKPDETCRTHYEECFTLTRNDYALLQLPEESVVEYLEFHLARTPYFTREDVEKCVAPQCNGQYIWNTMKCHSCNSTVPRVRVGIPLFSGEFPGPYYPDNLSHRFLLLLREKGGSGKTILQETKKRSVSVRVGFGCENNERCLKVTVEELVCVKTSLESVGLRILKEDMAKTRGK